MLLLYKILSKFSIVLQHIVVLLTIFTKIKYTQLSLYKLYENEMQYLDEYQNKLQKTVDK